ncbi:MULTISPECIES: hypothetical protein [unclassified Sinorhizobium]|uniref:hypothetical protein n=1 Tax=unclassified Sinorhizobium TaxID=2613772 RepID=UPI00352456A5
MNQITKRVVLHFPGFEPLDAQAHRARYERSAKQSAAVWNYNISTGELAETSGVRSFIVDAQGAGWRTQSSIHILDHDDLVRALRNKNFVLRLVHGYLNAARVALDGGMAGYFRHAWRFGLFFIFPFLLMAVGLLISLSMAMLPYGLGLSAWHFLWSIPVAIAFFALIFLPLAERLHTLHLFADWELAVAFARMDRAHFNQWLERCTEAARAAFAEEAEEYVISSHSMGSNVAAHVIGMLMEREPKLLNGKRVVFATLGGAILQCALLRPAAVLRSRVGLIARCKEIFWLDVHCLTDAIHFYKAPVVRLAGHADAPQANIVFIRIRHMLASERYRKIKRDFLRVHRQYVLGPDLRAPFDFTLLTAGPLPAASFAKFSSANMPSL